MAANIKAENPFRFSSGMYISELTGLRASSVPEMIKILKKVPESCIYYHTHRYLRQHQENSPEPPNDFAYWASHCLGEDELGESLASIDTAIALTINELREDLVMAMEKSMLEIRHIKRKRVNEGDQFNFIKSVYFIYDTGDIAYSLEECAEILKKVQMESIYFHMFEARLRLGRKRNDFSAWIEDNFDEKTISSAIAAIDPYTYTLEDLRKILIKIIGESKTPDGENI